MKKIFWTKDRFSEEIDLLEEHFAKFKMNVTFCHNDVWVNNVVYDKFTGEITFQLNTNFHVQCFTYTTLQKFEHVNLE